MTCEGSTQKIRASWVCDGKVDCRNRADERGCSKWKEREREREEEEEEEEEGGMRRERGREREREHRKLITFNYRTDVGIPAPHC